MTVIKTLSLRLVIDGRTVDLTGSGARYRYLYSGASCSFESPCALTGVEVELAWSILHSLITARSVTGEAVGFPMKLTAEDQRALAQFEARIGLAAEKRPDP